MNVEDAWAAVKDDIQNNFPAFTSEIRQAHIACRNMGQKMCIVHPEVETLSISENDITEDVVTVKGAISGWHKEMIGHYGFVIGNHNKVTLDDCISNVTEEVVCTSNNTPIEISAEIKNLEPNKELYARAYIILNNYIYYGNSISLKFEPTDEITPSQMVDLGLSVLWAGWNIGATKPEEYGNYYAWGETKEKSDYTEETYLHYYETDAEKEKAYIEMYINTNSEYNDVSDVWTQIYDVAYKEWGNEWRMPTYHELNELINDCKWEQMIYNGVNGVKITGPNGNSIFLPAGGFKVSTFHQVAGFNGYYWSSTGAESPCGFGCAYMLSFYASKSYHSLNIIYVDGSRGRMIRPVKNKE